MAGKANAKDNSVRDLTCEHCGYSWTYRGARHVFGTCPDCHAPVRLSKLEAR